MLVWISEWLANYFRFFHVVQYLTLRGILGTLTALTMSLWLGPVIIRQLSLRHMGQVVRDDGPQSHLSKAGTPTMGGTLILVTLLLSTLLWSDLSNRYVWLVLVVMVGFGAIGYWDDYRKLVLKHSRGMPARQKYLLQSLIGFGAAFYLYFAATLPAETQLVIPFFKQLSVVMGPFFIVLTYFVIVGASNAVNLTDGLAGLAIMPCVMIGGALGVLAVIVRQEIVFFIMSGIFVLETVSVILQVASYKLTGKRLFKMAPIHHHFELKGWPDPRVIVRFWIITFVLVLFGLATLKLR